MKYAIVTFGCRVNQADSFQIEAQLLANGGAPVPAQDAELIVVNSCSVTSAADQGTRQIIRKLARENPTARIIVTGCYATRRPDEIAAMPGVVQIVSNTVKDEFAREIGLTSAERFSEGDGACGAALLPGVAGRTAYTVRVQTGCSEACAYCIIPSTRGAGRSRSIEDVLGEIERAGAHGFREMALTGVHLGSYGRDRSDGASLLGLLGAIERRFGGRIRFRISSLEPMDCSDPIVDMVAGSLAFAPHFHLPLQHASDRVLVAMCRPYTLAYYRRLVDRIRARVPAASIGSDIIVGFPGETEDDFELLTSYLEKSPLTHVHVFPYSDRPGTAAETFPDKVHGSIVRERARRVRSIGKGLTERFHRAQDGAVRPGLTIEDGTLVVTDNYLKVRIPPGLPRNEWLTIRVTAGPDQLTGELVSPESSAARAWPRPAVPETSSSPPR